RDDAPAAPPAPADRAALSEIERQLLGFALELAEEEIHARNLEIPEKDRAALTSLRTLADAAAAGVQPPTTSEARLCDCGSPIEWKDVDVAYGPGWVHTPGPHAHCANAQPAAPAAPEEQR
ncbi:hypothetical protein ABZW50_34160, partial [Streptomyces bacillaris]